MQSILHHQHLWVLRQQGPAGGRQGMCQASWVRRLAADAAGLGCTTEQHQARCLPPHHAQKLLLRSVWSVASPCTLLNHCRSLSTRLTSAMGTWGQGMGEALINPCFARLLPDRCYVLLTLKIMQARRVMSSNLASAAHSTARRLRARTARMHVPPSQHMSPAPAPCTALCCHIQLHQGPRAPGSVSRMFRPHR